MAALLFCKSLLNYLKPYPELDTRKQNEIAKGIIGMLGDFIYDVAVPSTWQLRDIERTENQAFIFHWISKTDQALCSTCGTVSSNKAHIYNIRHIQDLPLSGMSAYHAIKANRYFCYNPDCAIKTFVEQFADMADKDARLTNRLKDFIVRQAIESSCNATASVLKEMGIKVNNDTINYEIKKKGAVVIAQNLKRDDVHVLSVDDINLRKGNSSTACSVFIDAETHRVLVIVEGATGAIAEKIMQQYPLAGKLSRDRASAYASAAGKCGKEQTADRFHLMQNMHTAIKKALFEELTQDLYIREGEGWTRIVDRAEEISDPSEDENDLGLVVLLPATLAAEDIERRIRLAGLNTVQANKYRKTIALLEWTESGFRTADIMKKLAMKKTDVLQYRKAAPETLTSVEDKIDEYYKMQEKGQWEVHQKTIAKTARPSSESIVEPYKETVLRMFNEGENHRTIHPVITQEGFKGSANTVYQYMIKYAHENNIAYGYNARVIAIEERNDHNLMPRPPRISIARVSRQTLYNGILHTAAQKKAELKQASQESAPKDSLMKDNPSIPMEWVNKTNYEDSIAEMIVNTKPKEKTKKKKLNEEAFERLGEAHPIIPRLATILMEFKEVMMSADVAKMDDFMGSYKNDPIEKIATFASGLKKDSEAVKNSMIYPEISNGPIEGTNNKIKMMRRRGYGRAGIELINALAVLPWHYKDVDEKKAVA